MLVQTTNTLGARRACELFLAGRGSRLLYAIGMRERASSVPGGVDGQCRARSRPRASSLGRRRTPRVGSGSAGRDRRGRDRLGGLPRGPRAGASGLDVWASLERGEGFRRSFASARGRPWRTRRIRGGGTPSRRATTLGTPPTRPLPPRTRRRRPQAGAPPPRAAGRARPRGDARERARGRAPPDRAERAAAARGVSAHREPRGGLLRRRGRPRHRVRLGASAHVPPRRRHRRVFARPARAPEQGQLDDAPARAHRRRGDDGRGALRGDGRPPVRVRRLRDPRHPRRGQAHEVHLRRRRRGHLREPVRRVSDAGFSGGGGRVHRARRSSSAPSSSSRPGPSTRRGSSARTTPSSPRTL